MAFYEVSFVSKVAADGKPAQHHDDGRSAVKTIPVWDTRDLYQLKDDYRSSGSLTLERLAPQHSPGRPLERRGPLVIFAPYLISIEVDIKSQQRQPGGPVEFVTRTPRDAQTKQDL